VNGENNPRSNDYWPAITPESDILKIEELRARSIEAGFFIPSFLFLTFYSWTIWMRLACTQLPLFGRIYKNMGGRVAILHYSVRNLPELVEGAV